MLAAAETGRTGFAGTADRSTLKLDVRETPNGLRLSMPPLRPPGGCFQQARTGADDPQALFDLLISLPRSSRWGSVQASKVTLFARRCGLVAVGLDVA